MVVSRARELGHTVRAVQSNHEGALIDELHQSRRWANGVIFNPGAFTHSSYALRDAIVATRLRVVEVHLSDITKREPWRRVSLLEEGCAHRILGKGAAGYLEALEWLARAGAPITARAGSAGGWAAPGYERARGRAGWAPRARGRLVARGPARSRADR